MLIRAATEEDAPAMGRLMVETWLAAHKGQIPDGQWQARQRDWTPEKSAQGWAETLRDMAAGETPDCCIYLAVETAVSPPNIIGLVMGGPALSLQWPMAGEIYAIYVQQAWQGRGAGKRLLETAVRHLAQLGMKKLLISCLETNEPARAFYEACGGVKVGEKVTEDYGYDEPQRIYGWENSSFLYQRGET